METPPPGNYRKPTPLDASTLHVDTRCRLNLGSAGMPAVASALHLGICMTCTQTMTGLPSLVVDCYRHGRGGYASLHHARCSPSQWRLTDQAPDYTTTCSLSYFLLDNDHTQRALIVVNPMLESVLVLPHNGQWHPSLHPQYAQAGMTLADPQALPPHAPGLHVTITADTIYLTDPAGQTLPDRPMAVPPEILQAARAHASVVVAVTHAADPQCIDDEMAMLRVLRSPLTYVGTAAVRG